MCAETVTAHFSWTKPDPGASASTWGTTLNQTIDKVDAQVFINGQAGVPVGTIMMWAGSAAPVGWLICDGSSLATAGTYATLFGVCGYTFGGSGVNFNLPNLTNRFAFGAAGVPGWGVTGGESTHTLNVGEMPVHAHTFNQTAHAHNNPQTPHSHGLTDAGHAHTISDPGHTHGASQVAHNHTVSGTSGAAGAGFAAGSGSTVATGTTSTAQPAVSIAAAATGITATNVSGTGLAMVAANANIGATDAQVISASIANAGSGGAHNNMPPFLQINFIVRYQ